MRQLYLLFVSLLLVACGTPEQRANDGSLFGTMTTRQVPIVTIDGKELRLAPGARIVGANNASITPNMVPPASRVRYKLDATGQVSQVWVLPSETK